MALQRARYQQNQWLLCQGIQELGFRSLLPFALHSSTITSFYPPEQAGYNFKTFYLCLLSAIASSRYWLD
ncbi:hypothetical protein [Bowmanella yangjiangensis]|uniref:Uncharacterized protein n=1 Tax=Bowmanella yangjiangensis TaxID=2811230 RepID=A0ABS3CXX0_9ALTE|nr:hypothetical protein [Bowmanella yangjiangensis]MBN7821170.1 hypothetical protein [Bowmanella yangjiangensis]